MTKQRRYDKTLRLAVVAGLCAGALFNTKIRRAAEPEDHMLKTRSHRGGNRRQERA